MYCVAFATLYLLKKLSKLECQPDLITKLPNTMHNLRPIVESSWWINQRFNFTWYSGKFAWWFFFKVMSFLSIKRYVSFNNSLLTPKPLSKLNDKTSQRSSNLPNNRLIANIVQIHAVFMGKHWVISFQNKLHQLTKSHSIQVNIFPSTLHAMSGKCLQFMIFKTRWKAFYLN